MKKKYNTKFPMARIKKIMQKDEEVGKVAQATPILISKALELFMQNLINGAADCARARHARTLSTFHLKECITNTQQFDFLKHLVESIPASAEKKPRRRKTEEDVGSSGGAGAGRGRGRPRKGTPDGMDAPAPGPGPGLSPLHPTQAAVPKQEPYH